jgi:hypothetical protein
MEASDHASASLPPKILRFPFYKLKDCANAKISSLLRKDYNFTDCSDAKSL